MAKLEDLEPGLQEAVKKYRQSGRDVSKYDSRISKYDRDEDYVKLREAIESRNYWESRIKEMIKGREKELFWVLIG